MIDNLLMSHLKETSAATVELLHTMVNFLVIVDFEGKIVLASDSVYEKTKLSREELLDQPYYRYLRHQDDSPLSFFDLLLLSTKKTDVELVLKTKDENTLIPLLLISAATSKNFFQQEDYLILLFADLRDQKESQAKLLHSSKLASLGEMAASVAHEINNPLTVIDGQMRMLIESLVKVDADVSFQTEIANKISKNINRITKIIRSLQTVSRSGDEDPFELITLRQFIDSGLEMVQHKFKTENIEFDMKICDPKLEIECRTTQLLQVFINLISNSVDAILDCEKKWIRVETELEGELLHFRFIDSGTGIDLATKIRLFEPFYTTKDIGRGTGLGLSVSKGIAESHNGILRYEPEQANTCFLLSIPIRQGSIH